MNVNQVSIYVRTSMESRNCSGIHFSSVLITISMNLFDQLVIFICDIDLKGYAPSGKNLLLGLLFVIF